MIMKRVLGLLRSRWPQTHILLRGDGHFSTPELMQLIVDDGNADFIFGLAGNSILSRKAEGLMRNARGHLNLHRSLAKQGSGHHPARSTSRTIAHVGRWRIISSR